MEVGKASCCPLWLDSLHLSDQLRELEVLVPPAGGQLLGDQLPDVLVAFGLGELEEAEMGEEVGPGHAGDG